MLRPAQIEVRVRELLRRLGITEPPVPVVKIAKSLGAKVRAQPLEDGAVSGALYRSARETVIGVNTLDAGVRKRFTVGHEIGHLLLHADALHLDRGHHVGVVPPGVGLKPALRFRRDKVSSEAKDYREIEANRFAAALLMPLDLLARDLKSMESPVTVEEVQKLADRYRVSQQAMTFRLTNLGVSVETLPYKRD